MKGRYYKNNKTGDVYLTAGKVFINATNDRDGQRMVSYTDGENFFVRDEHEFHNKFTQTEDPT